MTDDKKWNFVTHVLCGTPVELRQTHGSPDDVMARPIEIRCPKCARVVDASELSSPGPYSATW